MRWGLVGPGGIAQRFADALSIRADARLHAVVGRSAERAQAFAARWGAEVRADLAALLADPAIDAVYIAAPHSEHAAIAADCLRAGKPVLCEKPLAANAAQAAGLVALARERGVFLMEALWTRYLPALRAAEAWLREGRIGRVRALQSSFGFQIPFDPDHRCFAPALAGGALLDIGIYNLSLSQWALALQGALDMPALQAAGTLAPTGVEQRCAVQMRYADGTLSQFSCAFDSVHDNRLRLYGERGSIELGPRCWEPVEARLLIDGAAPQVVAAPFARNGFEYQIDAAMAAIRAGAIEEARMPHEQTLAVLRQIDALRRELGAVRFPFEAAAAG
jgi:predicted dehydrogenase